MGRVGSGRVESSRVESSRVESDRRGFRSLPTHVCGHWRLSSMFATDRSNAGRGCSAKAAANAVSAAWMSPCSLAL